MYYFWLIAPLAIVIYCVARAILDIRSKQYAWAVFGLICAGLILMMPMEMTIDLPVP
ncbi:MAG: hypothetical protein ABJP02_00565 [Parasphingorhabdus sp.]|uniref:hypothetical protein n=1 Tax=Parasphingorhabdus sp. TaxID=2709688 RepID=UPI00329A7216